MPIRTFKHLLSRVAATAMTLSAGAAPGDAATDDAAESTDPADDGAGVAAQERNDAGHGLAVELAQLPPLEATQRACELALSTDRDRRLSIAVALEWAFRLAGDDIVIDHLASDPDASIRRAAARAAWVRRTLGGDPGVLARLAGDPDPSVREVALLAGPER